MAGRTSISYSVAGLGEICALVLLVLHVACDLADVVTCLHVGHGVGGGHGDEEIQSSPTSQTKLDGDKRTEHEEVKKKQKRFEPLLKREALRQILSIHRQ